MTLIIIRCTHERFLSFSYSHLSAHLSLYHTCFVFWPNLSLVSICDWIVLDIGSSSAQWVNVLNDEGGRRCEYYLLKIWIWKHCSTCQFWSFLLLFCHFTLFFSISFFSPLRCVCLCSGHTVSIAGIYHKLLAISSNKIAELTSINGKSESRSYSLTCSLACSLSHWNI